MDQNNDQFCHDRHDINVITPILTTVERNINRKDEFKVNLNSVHSQR